MKRHKLRESLFRLVFAIDFNDLSQITQEDIVDCLYKVDEIKPKELEQLQNHLRSILEHLADIDQVINTAIERWTTSSMAKAELSVLRLAVYEMMYVETVPTAVAINEAVELIKEYGEDSSPRFVNGVLRNVADYLARK